MDSEYNQYFLTSSINYVIVNKLNAKDFILSDIDCLYKATTIQHIINEVLGHYFAKAIYYQKIELDGI